MVSSPCCGRAGEGLEIDLRKIWVVLIFNVFCWLQAFTWGHVQNHLPITFKAPLSCSKIDCLLPEISPRCDRSTRSYRKKRKLHPPSDGMFQAILVQLRSAPTSDMQSTVAGSQSPEVCSGAANSGCGSELQQRASIIRIMRHRLGALFSRSRALPAQGGMAFRMLLPRGTRGACLQLPAGADRRGEAFPPKAINQSFLWALPQLRELMQRCAVRA